MKNDYRVLMCTEVNGQRFLFAVNYYGMPGLLGCERAVHREWEGDAFIVEMRRINL